MKPEVIICSRVERKNINSTGEFEILNTESAILVQDMKKSGGGISSVQQLDIIADIEVELATEIQHIPQLWRLTNSAGKTFDWGDNDYKSRCSSCNRKGDHSRISFQRVSPNTDL